MAYNVHVARRVADLTLRQVRHWDQKGLVKPSVQAAHGRGSRRLYSFDDLVELRMIARLRRSGLSLQRIARLLRYVRKHLGATGALKNVRLLTDGDRVFVRSDDRAAWEDVLRGGQIVWFVPVDEARREAQAIVEALSAGRRERLNVAGRKLDVTFEPDLEAGGWVAECPALPGCVSEGSTLTEARRMIREAARLWIEVASASSRKLHRARRAG